MKVSEIKYQRADLERTKADIARVTQQVKNAGSAQDVLSARAEYLEILVEFRTYSALAHIRFTLNTKDEFYQGEMKYYDEIHPLIAAQTLEFIRAVLASPYLEELKAHFPKPLIKFYEVSSKSFDERIVEDKQQENAVVTEYTKLMAETLFEFRGEKLPRALLGKHMKSGDRAVRREAYEALGRGLESISEQLDDIFDRLVKIRHRMACKMGFENFVELGYYRMERLCYDKETVKVFRENVLTDVVPVVTALKRDAAKNLGIDSMMLYDNDVYFKQGDAAPEGTVEQIFESGKRMYHEMSAQAGEFIDMMIKNDAFDVLPRDGKWGGGYMSSLPKYKQPFILANFNGTADDVDVLTHEAGHALADYLGGINGNDPELYLGGMETAEVHSMSMEFLCWPWMELFFGERAEDYKYSHLAGSLTFIPYGVIVDYFQQLIYENPDMTPAERNQTWLELEKKYRPHLSAEGIPYIEKGTRWQYQMHIYEMPFYYIDYCLAQSVALQFLLESRKNRDGTFARYFEFIGKGGMKVFTDLVKEAGLQSPFQPGALKAVAVSAEKLLDLLR